MELTSREVWALVHGVVAGTIFLLAFAGGVAGLWSFRAGLVTPEGIRERLRRLWIGTWGMALIAWVTVITGTYVVYPWYRAKPPEGTTDLADYPRSLLLGDPNTDLWHKFGMEWKEHIGWATPVLATAVAFIVSYYGWRLADNPRIRYAALALFVLAFTAAVVAGGLGALITKAAPLR
jgi:NADH:ubiquinone oxidoreductase subunit 6 (subunit J)